MGKCSKCGKTTNPAVFHICEGSNVTVEELIKLLLKCDINHYVIVKRNGEKISNAEICTTDKPTIKGLGVLLG